jgi:arsenite-transporting ATPase
MRVLLFTGKGGVGKTTVAAATATLAASRGSKTLVISTDPAHSLADAFGVQLAVEPTEVDTGLYGQQVDAQRRFEASWRQVQGYLRQVLDAAGADPVEAEELTLLPGAEELLALLEVRAQVRSGIWDLVVVDCAPTAETLRLLALPEMLGFYVARLAPLQRRFLRSLRPAFSRASGLPGPDEQVLGALGRLHAELADIRRVLTSPEATVRLVATPEAMVLAEARRALTSLCLYGYRVDAVVANRIFPAEAADSWRSRWVGAQRTQLAEMEASFAPLPVYRAGYRAGEPVGLADLQALAADAYGGADPLGGTDVAEPFGVDTDGEEFVLRLSLPQVDRGEVDLARVADELVVTVAGRRRLLSLPGALRRCEVAGAHLVDGVLRVRFRPDPALWLGHQ